jgi:hypothetical protein
LVISTSTAQQILLTDNLPSQTAFTAFTGGTTGVVNGSQVTWNLGTLAPGTYSFSFNVQVNNSAPNGTVLSNSASVSYLGGSSSVSANTNNVTVVALTPTATFMATATPTPTGNQGVVIFPNPVTGPAVNILPPSYAEASDVRIEIFTAAFRKVQDQTYPNVPPGVAITVELKDKWEAPLADGLYYVIVFVDGHRSVAKLLILR